MSDTGIQVSAEDRERLAKSKFGEWFDEFFEKKFEEAMKKSGSQAQHPSQPQPQTTEASQQPQRRRSLLEECFSQTFGF